MCNVLSNVSFIFETIYTCHARAEFLWCRVLSSVVVVEFSVLSFPLRRSLPCSENPNHGGIQLYVCCGRTTVNASLVCVNADSERGISNIDRTIHNKLAK